MAADLDLKIVIDTLLQAKGFDEAQAGLKGLAGATNESGRTAAGAGGKQRDLARDLGGSRGAVADLTRVFLANIGVTGAAGQVARTAGLSMTALGGAISPVMLAATGLVAVAALLIPKIIEWAKESKDLEKANKELKDSIVGMLPELEEYVRTVPRASEELKKLFAVSHAEAMTRQKKEIEDLTKAMSDNEAALEKLRSSNVQMVVDNIRTGESHRVVKEMTIEQRDKAAELTETIDQQRGKLEALMAAQYEETTLGGQVRTRIDQEREAREKVTKAMEAERREAEKLKKIREGDLQLAFRLKSEKAKEETAARKQHFADVDFAATRILQLEAERAARKTETKEAIQSSKEKRAAEAELFASRVGYYTSFFTQNKAVRIAQAIADTYAAANRALAEGGPYLGPVLAAAMIAAGLKNIAEIRKTEAGFDVPVNDALAQAFGEKWGRDFIRHVDIGMQRGMMSGQQNVYNQTTINRGTTNNIGSISGVIGSRTLLRRQLTRELIRGNRAEDRTRLR